jgi:heat shock protein HslJ
MIPHGGVMIKKIMTLGAALLIMAAAMISCNNPSLGGQSDLEQSQAGDEQNGSETQQLSGDDAEEPLIDTVVPPYVCNIRPPVRTITPLNGTKWKLVGIQSWDKSSYYVLQPFDCERCYTLEFDTDSTFTGRATVNSFFGVYDADYASNNMKFEVLMMSEAYDSTPSALLFEKMVWKISVGSFYLQENELRLYHADSKEYLIFQSVPRILICDGDGMPTRINP